LKRRDAFQRIASQPIASWNFLAMSHRRPAIKPSPVKQLARTSTMPLGALAAGVGLSLLGGAAMAQNVPEAASAASTAASSASDDSKLKTLGNVKVTASALREKPAAKQEYQAVTSTIGKGKQALRDIPQSVTVVTEKLMEDRNLTDLKDVLRTTAGVTFLAGETGEEDVRLRGFSLQQAGDLYIDGMRDPSLYERDTFNYDRVEVLRGSASMIFGRGSTGGVVNQVNKSPFLMDQSELETTVGTGNMYRVTADVNKKLSDTSAIRVNAMKQQSNNKGATIDKEGIAPSISWGLGTADEFTASLFHLKYNNNPIYAQRWFNVNGKLTPGMANDAFYGFTTDHNNGTADYATLSNLHRFADGGELKTAIRQGHYDRDVLGTVPAFGTTNGAATTSTNISDATLVTRTQNKARLSSTTATLLQSDYTNKFQLADMTHAVIAGADLSWDKGSRQPNYSQTRTTTTAATTTLGDTNPGGAIVDTRAAPVFNYFNSRNVGAYAQDTIAITPTIKLIGGLRHDSFSAHYYNTTENYSRADELTSHRFGALYQPNEWASFHVSRGTSFNVSADAYQYELGAANRAKQSNTAPEKSRNTEIGTKLNLLDERLSVNASLFYSEKYNERNTDPDTTATMMLLSGKRHAAGLDFDIAGRITDKWEAYLSWTWIPDARIDQAVATTNVNTPATGDRPGLTPKHSGSLWNTYQITPQWRAGLGINHRGSQTPITNKNIRADDFTTFDAMAEYTINWRYSLRLNATNLANTNYIDQLYSSFYVAGAPRSVQLTFKVTL
jgi:catecholate siderophore receptor